MYDWYYGWGQVNSISLLVISHRSLVDCTYCKLRVIFAFSDSIIIIHQEYYVWYVKWFKIGLNHPAFFLTTPREVIVIPALSIETK